jgi:CubicO group peptidase (beta-lactamase class C family)
MKTPIIILLATCLLACTPKSEKTYNPPVQSNDGLEVSTIQEHQFDQDKFQQISTAIAEGRYGNIHSLLVLHQNELIVEQYFNGWKSEELHYMASTTKSMSAILTGMAIQQGKIKDADELMTDFFPDYASLQEDTLKQQIAIKHLLTNTSGFQWDEKSLPVNDPINDGVRMDRNENWLKASLALPMAAKPGTKYAYSGPNNIIIGEIIKRASEQNVADFANEYLFQPLGIKNYHWFSKNGICDLGGGLKLRSRDIAKYALLHLNKGQWNGKQIVSTQWMEEIFTPVIEIKHPFYSCCQWQMVKDDDGLNSWFIPGNGGQLISITPGLKLVIVINADNKRIPKSERSPLEYLIKDLMSMHPESRASGQ